MKTFACLFLLVAVVAAEPPRYRFARLRVQREELNDGPEEGGKERGEEAPYSAAGYRPSEEFNLPSRNEERPSFRAPENSYNTPFKVYTRPRVEYGVPERREGKEEGEGERREEKGEGGRREEKGEEREGGESENCKEREEKKENLEEEPKRESDVESNHGVYYVFVPNPQLERVQYQTENDLRNNEYIARLQYKNEGAAPLFVYSAVPQYQSGAYVQLI